MRQRWTWKALDKVDKDRRDPAFAVRISQFVVIRGAGLLPADALERVREHLTDLCLRGEPPPVRGRGFDWVGLAAAWRIEPAIVARAAPALRPGLVAMRSRLRIPPKPRRPAVGPRPAHAPDALEPLTHGWVDPPQFHLAFDLHMRRHRDNAHRVRRALFEKGCEVDQTTLGAWRRGSKAPTHARSFKVLALLEERWRLPKGYFRAKLPHRARAAQGQATACPTLRHRRELSWHLPEDFEGRPRDEQAQILEWIGKTVLSGTTDYRRYQAAASREVFGLRFPGLQRVADGAPRASPELTAELTDLIAFKTAPLAPIGCRRSGLWGEATAAQKLAHLGLMFGALAASPSGAVRGHGLPVEDLSLAMLVSPNVWDWYLEWRRQRRGFYTRWERQMIAFAAALSHPVTGWLTQSPQIARRLCASEGLVSEPEAAAARADWVGACAALHGFARQRSAEIGRLSRVHHDPFEAILPVLEAESPLGEYRKIAQEVLRLAPCPDRYPLAAAEASRAVMMIRLGLHLGFRQRNLRELLICARGERPRSERDLTTARRAVRSTSAQATYNTSTFYQAWRAIIQRYGVRNPWTGRGRSLQERGLVLLRRPTLPPTAAGGGGPRTTRRRSWPRCSTAHGCDRGKAYDQFRETGHKRRFGRQRLGLLANRPAGTEAFETTGAVDSIQVRAMLVSGTGGKLR